MVTASTHEDAVLIKHGPHSLLLVCRVRFPVLCATIGAIQRYTISGIPLVVAIVLAVVAVTIVRWHAQTLLPAANFICKLVDIGPWKQIVPLSDMDISRLSVAKHEHSLQRIVTIDSIESAELELWFALKLVKRLAKA